MLFNQSNISYNFLYPAMRIVLNDQNTRTKDTSWGSFYPILYHLGKWIKKIDNQCSGRRFKMLQPAMKRSSFVINFIFLVCSVWSVNRKVYPKGRLNGEIKSIALYLPSYFTRRQRRKVGTRRAFTGSANLFNFTIVYRVQGAATREEEPCKRQSATAA